MKKSIFALTLFLTLGLVACNSKNIQSASSVKENISGTIIEKKDYKNAQELFDDGYIVQTTYDESQLVALFYKNEEVTNYYLLQAKMTEEKMNEFEALDFFASDYEEKKNEIIAGLEQVSLECVTSILEEAKKPLDNYIGKTLGDMVDDGFENWGYSISENEYFTLQDNGTVNCKVYVSPKKAFDDFSELSDKQYRALKITQIDEVTFSSNFISQYMD